MFFFSEEKSCIRLRSFSNRADKKSHIANAINGEIQLSNDEESNLGRKSISLANCGIPHFMRNEWPLGEQVWRNHKCQIVYWPHLIISGVYKNSHDKIAPNRAAPSHYLALSSDLPKIRKGESDAVRGRLRTCKAANLLLRKREKEKIDYFARSTVTMWWSLLMLIIFIFLFITSNKNVDCGIAIRSSQQEKYYK